MAFWLAAKRNGQDSDWIQRFDPRFWTVNFPRPMMAGVVATSATSLRVDCEFHHKDELAGLIWESADHYDHPLLGYTTDRDYSRTTLRFHWKSSGLIPLDQVNGPALTIEGRDASGAPVSWFVRLWNYATGSATDADIVLPFSAITSGWSATDPGAIEVYPGDIDRIFISLAPPGYAAGDPALLPARVNGWAELTNIACEGYRPMLEIGDVLLPPHGIQTATAYDDCYNQTPQRVLRNVRGLGYRGRIIHYVGMSHYFRLDSSSGTMKVSSTGSLCTPAESWQKSYFATAAQQGFAIIASLSYEVLADHCYSSWQQRAWDGSPALTGWDPPSTLLSPAHVGAMTWLRTVATKFVALLEEAGLPVLFQIGEPWWWVDAGKICIYDSTAKAALGGSPVNIPDLRAPLSQAQKNLLDAAGTLLAQSTADLASAVRAAATGPCEILLLVFTPTTLDPTMPELRRANMPTAWASPAFDRLQVEDYDWVTTGAEANRRSAYQVVQQRLAYPASKQDYMAGFVLSAAQAEAAWPFIDDAVDEAADRSITQRFVWALPQITRDGYTRLAPPENDTMQAFDDVLYPLALGRDASCSPEFSTSIAVTASGHERRGSLWSDARLRFDAGPGVRSEEEMTTLIAFFRARRGAARGFRFSDPFDFSSNAMTGTPTMTDQLLGSGDALSATFQLVKRYGDGEEAQIRPITRPRVGTVLVSINGSAASGWTIVAGGKVQFSTAPAAGAVIRAGFLFDVPVRFAEDRLEISGAAFLAGEAPSVPLIEIREVP